MALVKCKECGKEVSEFAVSCPNCGFPLSKSEFALPEMKEATFADKNIIDSKETIATENVSTHTDAASIVVKTSGSSCKKKSTHKNKNKIIIAVDVVIFAAIVIFLLLPHSVVDFENKSISTIKLAVSGGEIHKFDTTGEEYEAYGFTSGAEFCGMTTNELEFYFIDDKCVGIYLETTNDGSNADAVEKATDAMRSRYGYPQSMGTTCNDFGEWYSYDKWGESKYIYSGSLGNNKVLLNLYFEDF